MLLASCGHTSCSVGGQHPRFGRPTILTNSIGLDRGVVLVRGRGGGGGNGGRGDIGLRGGLSAGGSGYG